jgi:hypothetical protein
MEQRAQICPIVRLRSDRGYVDEGAYIEAGTVEGK